MEGSHLHCELDDGRLTCGNCATPALTSGQHIEVPTGVALSPKELLPPRALAERFLRVEHWTEMPRGGHFAALEEPELLAEDLRAFFRTPYRVVCKEEALQRGAFEMILQA